MSDILNHPALLSERKRLGGPLIHSYMAGGASLVQAARRATDAIDALLIEHKHALLTALASEPSEETRERVVAAVLTSGLNCGLDGGASGPDYCTGVNCPRCRELAEGAVDLVLREASAPLNAQLQILENAILGANDDRDACAEKVAELQGKLAEERGEETQGTTGDGENRENRGPSAPGESETLSPSSAFSSAPIPPCKACGGTKKVTVLDGVDTSEVPCPECATPKECRCESVMAGQDGQCPAHPQSATPKCVTCDGSGCPCCTVPPVRRKWAMEPPSYADEMEHLMAISRRALEDIKDFLDRERAAGRWGPMLEYGPAVTVVNLEAALKAVESQPTPAPSSEALDFPEAWTRLSGDGLGYVSAGHLESLNAQLRAAVERARKEAVIAIEAERAALNSQLREAVARARREGEEVAHQNFLRDRDHILALADNERLSAVIEGERRQAVAEREGDHEVGAGPSLCDLCGHPMPEGEEMFRYHGYSGSCPTDRTGGTE